MVNKRVSFDNIVSVVQIPTVQEFRSAGLADLLWWNSSDYNSFKLSAAEDVKEHVKSINFSLNGITAVRSYLYTFFEPEDISNTEENFRLTSESLSFASVEEVSTTSKATSPSWIDQRGEEAPSNQLAFLVEILVFGIVMIMKRNAPRTA
jgi:hypothetical protein